ncbi:hypothetical protein ACFYKX_09735 [Cytobacillus sp. FJAT-54145]|uniref:DUF3990 domain-containing protein n=1 Tax=Cytobacillus spartinae TaxID=3299023 RepID=A0ABW6K9L6_9BACI
MQLFIGYHGTSKQNAINILKTSFTIDYKKIGWLGTGIYFYEENSEMAVEWALYKCKSAPKDVIRSEIKIPAEEVFDVSIPGSKDNRFFHELRRKLVEVELSKKNLDITVKNKKDFDGKTYNFICKTKGYKLVRAFTYTYTDQDRSTGLDSRVPNGIELCLKQPSYVQTKDSIYAKEDLI